MSEVEQLHQQSAPESDGVSEPSRRVRLYRPHTDIFESDDGVELRVEMPGVSLHDVELEVERQVLTIKGQARIAKPEGFTSGYSEYGEGDYQRSFRLSEALDGSRIEAQIGKGVLTVRVPYKEAHSRLHRVEVKAA